MVFSKPLWLIILLALQPSSSCISLTVITPKQPLKDGDILISAGKTFALGFFSPAGNTRNRYVGIWYYKIPQQTVVWVANRDTPLNDTSGVLSIDGRGDLVIYGSNNSRSSVFWSANASVHDANSSMAKLLDVGNLVLLPNNTVTDQTQTPLWQSFDYPTDTMLPYMKLGLNRVTGLDRFITSWKSPEDPGTGSCTYRFDPNGYPQLFLYKGRAPFWRTGSWTGHEFSGVPEMTPFFIFNGSYVDNQDEISTMYGLLNDSIFTRSVVNESGMVRRSTWHDQTEKWQEFWSAPRELCDNYRHCGSNGICDRSNVDRFECKCLPGLEPKSPGDWFLRDGSGGCVRKQGLAPTCGKGEGFVKLARVKIPDTSKARVNMRLSLEACEKECLGNCSCTAYASARVSGGGVGCLTWHGDLVDSRTYPTSGQDFYVRVDSITLAKYKKESNGSISKTGKVAIALGSFAVLLIILFLFMYWWARTKRKAKERQIKYGHNISKSLSTYFDDFSVQRDLDESGSELPVFDLKTIAAATDNFSIHDKLGEGGFGSVYKGVFYEGTEIAVKRLSRQSSQGSEEFKNEALLIAKLQHRNLVRVLGYCNQQEEKMLIYEYLPNKSLDFFIFDEEKRKILDWSKRFDIIRGIVRGMLYLHEDSRLRIIHRDLKASNILLDADLKPKISDFGMARIFEGDELEANTNRVVGTYGYMSPEYAMEGRFSFKSDVYSLGVLILEIVTRRKNIGYRCVNPTGSSNLIGQLGLGFVE
ncbi:G-type lectin S-receptor-like serine/threonine-protein kinase RKS1 isoform X2 [Humulus lupulus]|uniref:G-type lectin S-receptor-like serine/threonine-protein kinase RKS1 isoform X2 n=1 Tax=Humulus lupulus TaxID=3486 RepID=UPI002B40EF59|nr:G-type lectin S-receptor-like serine/threonine-protein kinase RKS1 isoform X2 [Humulus lupulus]